MPQVFHHSTNLISKFTIFGSIFFLVVLFFFPWIADRSPYIRGERIPRNQPVPFSHKHHVRDDGIDCRYCHTSVETSSFAGLPSTEICMTCHSQIWKNAEMLEPVRASFRTGRSISWTRVNALPGFVYFNHSIHIAKGIGCTTCHGPIGDMPITWDASTLVMGWCLNCHRDPAKYIRPKKYIYSTTYQPPANQMELGRKLMKEYNVYSLQDCYTCHR